MNKWKKYETAKKKLDGLDLSPFLRQEIIKLIAWALDV